MSRYIDPALAREQFSYNPETGDVTRLSNNKKFGSVTTCNGGKQYYRGAILGRQTYAHRLAWVLQTGEQPQVIDHIDGDGFNNKWINLKSGSYADNNSNKKMFSNNTSGHNGVCWRKDANKWAVCISVEGIIKRLGHYDNIEAAVAVRAAANKLYNFNENHGIARA